MPSKKKSVVIAEKEGLTIGTLIRQKSHEIDTLRILKKEHGAGAKVEVAGDNSFIIG